MLAATSHIVVSAATACADGTVYLRTATRIYAIDTDGLLRMIAGTGSNGFTGDGGPARDAMLDSGGPVVCDRRGNLYLADSSRIRRINAKGIISTVAGNGLPQDSSVQGDALSIPIGIVRALATDDDGTVYFTGVNRVSAIKPDGMVMLVAGAPGQGQYDDGDGGKAVDAHLVNPGALAIDSAHNLYIQEPNRVRKVSPDGIITTPIGLGFEITVVDGMDASSARLDLLTSMAINQEDELLLGSGPSYAPFHAYRVTPDNQLHHFNGPDADLAFVHPSGSVYYGRGMLRRMNPDGSKETVAADGTFEFPDGTAATAAAFRVNLIAVDEERRLLFQDAVTCRIRRITHNGFLETVAGSGECTDSTLDDVNPITARLPYARSIAVGSDGSIFLAADGIYKIDTSLGTISRFSRIPAKSIVTDSRAGLIVTPGGNEVYVLNATGTESTLPVLDSNLAASVIDANVLALDRTTDTLHVFESNGRHWTVSTLTPTPSNPVLGFRVLSATISADSAVWSISSFFTLFRSVDGSSIAIGSCCRTSGDGDFAATAGFGPLQVAASPDGGVYLLDYVSQAVRKIDARTLALQHRKK